MSEVVTDHESIDLVLGQPKWCKGFMIFNSVRKHAQAPDFDVGKGIRLKSHFNRDLERFL